MKKFTLLFVFALGTMVGMANNANQSKTDPIKSVEETGKPSSKTNECATIEDTQCQQCGTCQGRNFCVGCDCSLEDCSKAFDILMEIMCKWKAACCFGTMEEGPTVPGGGTGN